MITKLFYEIELFFLKNHNLAIRMFVQVVLTVVISVSLLESSRLLNLLTSPIFIAISVIIMLITGIILFSTFRYLHPFFKFILAILTILIYSASFVLLIELIYNLLSAKFLINIYDYNQFIGYFIIVITIILILLIYLFIGRLIATRIIVFLNPKFENNRKESLIKRVLIHHYFLVESGDYEIRQNCTAIINGRYKAYFSTGMLVFVISFLLLILTFFFTNSFSRNTLIITGNENKELFKTQIEEDSAILSLFHFNHSIRIKMLNDSLIKETRIGFTNLYNLLNENMLQITTTRNPDNQLIYNFDEYFIIFALPIFLITLFVFQYILQAISWIKPIYLPIFRLQEFIEEDELVKANNLENQPIKDIHKLISHNGPPFKRLITRIQLDNWKTIEKIITEISGNNPVADHEKVIDKILISLKKDKDKEKNDLEKKDNNDLTNKKT